MRELDFQSEVVKSVKAAGGYGHKVSDRFKVGVPDLLISAPNQGIVLFECKSIADAMPDRFDRKTGITPIQQEHLKRINDCQILPVGAQLVYMVHKGEQRAIVWPAHLVNITSDYEKDERIWVERKRMRPNWDIDKLVKATRLMKSMPF
jgi:hypothetical protein